MSLERFNEFETWRLYKMVIHLKEDEVSKKSIHRLFICYQFNKCMV